MPDSERAAFLDAPISSAGLFGSSVKDFADRFDEVQKTSQAMKHFLPKRSSSAASRPKQPPAHSSKPPSPPTAAASQRRQARDPRPRSRSTGCRPPPRGPRPRIDIKPEAEQKGTGALLKSLVSSGALGRVIIEKNVGKNPSPGTQWIQKVMKSLY